MDKLKIDIGLLSGWWFKFEQGDKRFETFPDNGCYDPINDLVTAVRLLYKSFPETECRFFEGPGEYILFLNRDKNIIRGTVYSFDARAGLNKDKGTVVFKFDDNLFHFTNQIINAYFRLNEQQNIQIDYKELIDLMKEERNKMSL